MRHKVVINFGKRPTLLLDVSPSPARILEFVFQAEQWLDSSDQPSQELSYLVAELEIHRSLAFEERLASKALQRIKTLGSAQRIGYHRYHSLCAELDVVVAICGPGWRAQADGIAHSLKDRLDPSTVPAEPLEVSRLPYQR